MINKMTLIMLKSTQDLLKARQIEPSGPVQKFIDSEVIRVSEPYVPFRDGGLTGSATRNTKLGSGEVIYKTPYARRLYFNPQYNFAGAPMRGGYWFERMKADHKDTILKGAAAMSGGRT